MGTQAELSSLTSSLEELTRRVTGLADGANRDGDDELAAHLFSIERSLEGALRQLRRAART